MNSNVIDLKSFRDREDRKRESDVRVKVKTTTDANEITRLLEEFTPSGFEIKIRYTTKGITYTLIFVYDINEPIKKRKYYFYEAVDDSSFEKIIQNAINEAENDFYVCFIDLAFILEIGRYQYIAVGFKEENDGSENAV